MCKEQCRYALQYAGIDATSLTVTDGRRLLSVTLSDAKPKPGLYHISTDGWLLGPVPDARSFPKWSDLVLRENKRKQIWSGSLVCANAGSILWAINREADTALSLDLWLPAMQTLRALGADTIEIVRAKRQTQDAQIQIFGSLTTKDTFTYLQMPIYTGRKKEAPK
jgi:hypothetical protein